MDYIVPTVLFFVTTGNHMKNIMPQQTKQLDCNDLLKDMENFDELTIWCRYKRIEETCEFRR